MQCPKCHTDDTRVIDSRSIDDGAAIRRRRECSKCSFRFSTQEEIEILALSVVKTNGYTEPYQKEKMIRSLRLPLQKRPITPARIKRTIHSIEQEIQTRARNNSISTHDIGEIVMKHLRRLDKVAYIRFASVYQSFDDIDAFADALKEFTQKKRSRKVKK